MSFHKRWIYFDDQVTLALYRCGIVAIDFLFRSRRDEEAGVESRRCFALHCPAVAEGEGGPKPAAKEGLASKLTNKAGSVTHFVVKTPERF